MIKIEMDWWKLVELAKASPEHYEQLRAVKSDLPSLEDAVANKGWHSFDALINDPADLPDEVLERVTLRAVRPLKFLSDKAPCLNTVKDALTLAQVHLPGNELLKIREVMVKEDCCTDVLQDRLKEGWKIIAVCPQPSRRPDYILGREFA